MRGLLLALILCLLASACATPRPSPRASPRSLPSRAVLRAAFEKPGAKFQKRTGWDGTKVLEATNSVDSASDRAFINVSIYGDPVHAVSVNLPGAAIDNAGRFPGSALIDVVDSFDPGVKRWFVAQLKAESSDPRLKGLGSEIDLNGLVAQIAPTHVPGMTVLIVETPPVSTPSN